MGRELKVLINVGKLEFHHVSYSRILSDSLCALLTTLWGVSI